MASSFQIQRQEKSNWCWAAVAATVSQYFYPQTSFPQCEIANKMANMKGINCCTDTSDASNTPEYLEDAFEVVKTSFGKSLVHERMPGILEFPAIQKHIDESRPVCVQIHWIDEDIYHLVIVSGYSVTQSGEHWVDVHDPARGEITVPYDSLTSSYLGAGEWVYTYIVEQA